MSHIVKFRIDNLAGRTDIFERTLDRHVNIFFGLNGCGKTSLLKILHSAMCNDASSLARVPFASASVTIYSIHYQTEFTRTLVNQTRTQQSPKLDEVSEILADDIPATKLAQSEQKDLQWTTTPKHNETSATKWKCSYLPTSRLLLGAQDIHKWLRYAGSERYSMTEEQVDVFFAESIKGLWVRYTATLLSRVREAQESGLASILKAVLATRVQSSNQRVKELASHKAYERMKKFVTRQGSPQLLPSEESFKVRYDEDSTLRMVVQDIYNIENDIEEASAPRKQLENLISSLFSGGKTLTFTDQSIEIKTSSGFEISLASLSSGEKHLLMLLVETLLADESSIIIDEPEISMHVEWQEKLISIIRMLSPNAQLVLATHSAEIMADIADEFIIQM